MSRKASIGIAITTFNRRDQLLQLVEPFGALERSR
jgi:hypothetical protein